jgi:Protein of unknown function (DUF3147)
MILEYITRFVVGGLLVCAFALLSQLCKPKQFAGIFSAAPSVLLAGLIITLFTTGASHAVLTVEGAIAGAIGLIAYCIAATPAIKHIKTLPGSLLSLVAWFLVALGSFALLRAIMQW